MLVVVSPAKKLNMDPIDSFVATEPDFSMNVKELIDVTRKLSVEDLQNLMGISSNLAKLNAERFALFGKQKKKPAAFAFAGDTYQGLDAGSLDDDDMSWAQKHIFILSGLYGLLRPLDAIEPYRLEMGSKLKTTYGNSLYDYWGTKLSEALNLQAKNIKEKVLINCASQEYFNAVDISALELNVITPVFMELRDGKEKIISFYAKKARGAMARYIIQQRMTDTDRLEDFNVDGYVFQPDKSDKQKMIFLRNNQE